MQGRKSMSQGNERKQRIIDAAIEVLKENGIEKTTMRAIAKKAGLTTGAIYHHYNNKDEMFFDVIKQSLQFTHKIASAVKNENSLRGEELLHEILFQVGKRLSKEDEQKLHILLINDVIAREGAIKEKYIKNYKEIINNTANLFEDAFELENSENKRAVASILVAAIDGIAIQQALGVLPEDLQQITYTFNTFFSESIPTYLKEHKKSEE